MPVSAPRAEAARVDVIILVNGKPRESVPVNFDVDAKTAHMKAAAPFQTEIRPAVRMEMPKEKSEVLIKTRDLVKIVAVVGSAHIEATGEAQQDGRLGEIIRVKNVESNRIVNGRIESRGVVLVDY
jgi:flagella basal body P-ring formation protein FlgA